MAIRILYCIGIMYMNIRQSLPCRSLREWMQSEVFVLCQGTPVPLPPQHNSKIRCKDIIIVITSYPHHARCRIGYTFAFYGLEAKPTDLEEAATTNSKQRSLLLEW